MHPPHPERALWIVESVLESRKKSLARSRDEVGVPRLVLLVGFMMQRVPWSIGRPRQRGLLVSRRVEGIGSERHRGKAFLVIQVEQGESDPCETHRYRFCDLGAFNHDRVLADNRGIGPDELPVVAADGKTFQRVAAHLVAGHCPVCGHQS